MQDQELYEQLADGTAYATPDDTDTDDSGTHVKIIPIGEGEKTRGHRYNDDESPAIWDRPAMQEAVEQGKLMDPLNDGPTKIVKGQGGTNPHYPIEEQVPVENILGRIDEWEYQEGVGPVGHAQLADETVASQIDLGLLGVSGDWLRRLGEYDADRDGKPVEEIVGLPRVTLLDRGAASSASIEPATAEALAYNPDGVESSLVELLQQVGDAVRWESDAGGEREPADVRYGVVINALPDGDDDEVLVSVYQANPDYDGWENRTDDDQPMSTDSLEVVGSDGVGSLPPISQVFGEQNAQLYPLRFHGFGEFIGEEYIGGAVSALEAIEGVTATASDADGDEAELVAIVDRETATLDSLNDDIRDALEDTPFEVFDDWDWVNQVEYLASRPDADASPSDEGPDSPTGSPSQDKQPDTPDMQDPDDDLKEQLAAVRSEKSDLEDEVDDLTEQLSEKESTIDEKKKRIDALEDEVEPLTEMLAEIAADGSMLDPEKVAETHDAHELVDMLAEQTDEEDDEKSYRERVKEQLAAPVTPRGQGTEENPDGPGDEVDEAEVEQLAEGVLGARELVTAGDAPAEHLREQHGVDPAEYVDEPNAEMKLRNAIEQAEAE